MANDLFPRLMVEVCLVLAPDVDFFLYSRKQGLPCQRSLFFSMAGVHQQPEQSNYLAEGQI